MNIMQFLIESINSYPAIVIVTIINLLVSLLIHNRSENRIDKLEIETKKLDSTRKKTEITRLLNESLMDLYQAKLNIELSKQLFIWLEDFFSGPISIEIKETYKSVESMESQRSSLEVSVRDIYANIQQESDLLVLEKYLVRTDAMRKAATMERERAESIYRDLLNSEKFIKNNKLDRSSSSG